MGIERILFEDVTDNWKVHLRDTEQTEAAGAGSVGIGSGEDRVTISTEGLRRAAGLAETRGGTQDNENSENPLILRLREKIQRLEEEIRELEDADSMTGEDKERQLQMKRSQLAEYQSQLQKALDEQNKASGASLRAKGATELVRPDF